jgi:hypothetical protein
MVAVADTLKEEAAAAAVEQTAAESQAVSIAVATAERLRAEQNAAEATVAEVAERLREQATAAEWLRMEQERLRVEQDRLRVEQERLRAEHEAAQAMVEWLRCEREAADMNVEQLRAEQGAVEAAEAAAAVAAVAERRRLEEEVVYFTQRLEEARAQLNTSGVPALPAAVAAPAPQPAAGAGETLFALCLDAPKDHSSVRCGHQCVCGACAGKAAVAGWRAVQPLPGARAEAASAVAETNDGSSSEEAWTDEDDAFDDWVPPAC